MRRTTISSSSGSGRSRRVVGSTGTIPNVTRPCARSRLECRFAGRRGTRTECASRSGRSRKTIGKKEHAVVIRRDRSTSRCRTAAENVACRCAAVKRIDGGVTGGGRSRRWAPCLRMWQMLCTTLADQQSPTGGVGERIRSTKSSLAAVRLRKARMAEHVGVGRQAAATILQGGQNRRGCQQQRERTAPGVAQCPLHLSDNHHRHV